MDSSRVWQVTGPPGTGKTTYLSRQVEAAAKMRGSDKIVVASLTKAAAHEMASRGVPIPEENIGTLHALCFRSLFRPKLTVGREAEWNDYVRTNGLPEAWKIGKASDDLDNVKPSDVVLDTFGAASKLEQLDLLRHREVPAERWPIGVQAFAKAWRAWKDEAELLDFTDLLEVCARETSYAPGHPEVLVGDEVQDWSRLETRLFRDVWGKAAQSVVMAGDPDQCLYEWRGSDPRIFLDSPVPEENRRVLGQSYRVPAAVHELATRWIGQIAERAPVEYHARDFPGSVTSTRGDWRSPELLLPELERWVAAGKSVMILGSCDYMLAPTIATLRREGLPFWNPFRKKHGGWNPLRLGSKRQRTAVYRLLAYLRPSMEGRDWTGEEIRSWVELLKSDGLLHRGAKRKIEAFPDEWRSIEFESLFRNPADALRAYDGELDWLETNALPKSLQGLRFPLEVARKRGPEALEKDPPIVVGTIHSVKGGQADVVVLYPDLSRLGFEEWSSRGGRSAIVRLFYVGMTRARESLVLASPASAFHPRIAA
jgi:superfamily I DNA/RNA helicase